MANPEKTRKRKRWVIKITIWTFFIALAVGFLTHYFLDRLSSLFISFLILTIVVLLGILFDLVGTAAAAADLAPLNAKAARRVRGAKKGALLVKNAEVVSNVCNDVAGDVSGIISGTLATMIVFRLVALYTYFGDEFYLNIFLTAFVAAITVGGKAFSKVIALNYPTEILLLVGAALTWLKNPFGLKKNESSTRGDKW